MKILKNAFCLLAAFFLLGSCLKNKDSTAKGPKSQMAVTSYIVNGALVDVSLDNSKITPNPLAFGKSIATGLGGYSAYAAGIHNIKISSATTVLADYTFSFEAGKNYSLFVYDTLKSNAVKAWLVSDNLLPVDTVAQSRFLQFIPGADSLKIILIKDTIGFVVQDTYIGNKLNPGTGSDFFISMPPGNYQVILQRRNNNIFQQSPVNLLAGKLYSFIASGTINGMGAYKETVTVLQHN